MTVLPSHAPLPFHTQVQLAVEQYLTALDGEIPVNMYELFLNQFEKPLLETVLLHTRGNQSKTAEFLGLNRGTLRAKMKQYGLLEKPKKGKR